MQAKYLIYVLVLMLYACAKQGAPSGGPRDTTPPRPDSIRSTRNYSTNFREKQIDLVFDEWVVLSDVATQVVISPPLQTRRTPEVKLKGKTVSVFIPTEEPLRPNTTYTINFGTAVKDFHENNPAKDLRFVFSTGPFIDSLTVQGTVRDVASGDPVENFSVMLYDVADDSVVVREKPYYFTKTDKAGQFTIRNVREGRFKCVAFDDADQNLKWTGDTERIGFPDSLLTLSDSTQPVVAIKVFSNLSRLRATEKNTERYGVVKLAYNARPDTVFPRPLQNQVRWLTERSADTLLVWYDLSAPGAWDLLAGRDTVPVKERSREDFLKNHRFTFQGQAAAPAPAAAGNKGNKGSKGQVQAPPDNPPPPDTSAPAPGRRPTAARNPQVPPTSQSPAREARLAFNFPVSTVDTARWMMILDSVPYRNFTVRPDSARPRELRLETRWTPGKNHLLTLLPGAVTDFYGVANTDTLYKQYNVLTEKLLGTLSLDVQNLTPGNRYVLQIINSNTQLEDERSFTASAASRKFSYPNLFPAQYTARLIDDRNGNGRWDSGDYYGHRQPEAVTQKKLDNLRPNWELEATLEAGSSEKSKK